MAYTPLTGTETLRRALRNLDRAKERVTTLTEAGEYESAIAWAEAIPTAATKVAEALRTLEAEAEARRQAEIIGRATGSVSATVRQERVSYATGERVVEVLAEGTWVRQ